MTSHVVLLPFPNERDEEVALKLSVKNLTEEVKVRYKGSLKNNRDVRGIEQFDWVRSLVATNASASKLKLDTETLMKKLANNCGKNLVACDQTSKEVSLVALCLTLAYVLRIRTAKYHHSTRFEKN